MLRPVRIIASVLIFLVGTTGCVRYHAKPLPLRPSFPADLTGLTVDPFRMPLPELASHRFDPRDGLDMTEVAMLAVANNPDLKIVRDAAGIATAQAFAAGLLPDPQLAASADLPTGNVPGSNFIGYNLGLSYDVSALLLRSSAKAAAATDTRKANLDLLWQEWQVVAQARLLFVRELEQKRVMAVLKENRALVAAHYQHSRAAFREGNLALDAASADFASLQALDKQINELTRQERENRFALNALLGLAPATRLELVGEDMFPRLDMQRVHTELPLLLSRRPDLMALKTGYKSEDIHLRAAIITQFPALNVGLHGARDTSNVHSVGPEVTVTLPIFNRNRGNIAVEEATRQKLYDEFQLRLNDAYAEVERILADQLLLEGQFAELQKGIANAERLARASEAAFREGNLTETGYLAARGALLDKRREKILLEQNILEQRVALLALVGGEIPAAGPKRNTP